MRAAALTCLFLIGLMGSATAQERIEVDLELILAVDISYSMDLDELALQREGYVSGLTSKEVLDAVREGAHGRIAVTYVEWAGEFFQNVVVPWQIIDGPDSAEEFAAKLAEVQPTRAYRTSIASALAYAAPLFDSNLYDGLRRVIDVSGDGPNNQGPRVDTTRDQLVSKGIAINGLPLMLKQPNAWTLDIGNLDDYYRECVIGGPGAFVVAVRDKAHFIEAIRTKLVLEISGHQPDARVIPVQTRKISCTIGERLWRERYGDGGGSDWQ